MRTISFFNPLFALAVLFATESAAQCVNTPTPTCGVYSSCFAKLCNCEKSPFEYFIGYGKKYCEVFLDLKSREEVPVRVGVNVNALRGGIQLSESEATELMRRKSGGV